ncbi:DUF4192 domain-containing protein [Nakamurella silvestris]|nr:DUF4192 domain-containing protein [Nakamurella silvestris]
MTTTPTDDEPIRISSITEMITATPYILGFRPTESVVLICLRDGRLGPIVRLDLPPERARRVTNQQVAAQLAEQATRHADTVLVLVYTDRSDRTRPAAGLPPGATAPAGAVAKRLPASRLITELTRELRSARIGEWDAALVRDGRWSSYYAIDGGSEPLPGPGPEDEPGARTALHEGLAGREPAGSRRELAATVDGPAGAVADDRRGLITDALLWWTGPGLLPRTAAEVTAAVEKLGARIEDGVAATARGRTTSDRVNAQIVAGLLQHDLRDEILHWCLRGSTDSLVPYLSALLDWTPDPAAAEIATVLALCAYRSGNGPLAVIALERGLEADPRHRLSKLMLKFFAAGPEPAELDRLLPRDEQRSQEWVNRDRAG